MLTLSTLRFPSHDSSLKTNALNMFLHSAHNQVNVGLHTVAPQKSASKNGVLVSCPTVTSACLTQRSLGRSFSSSTTDKTYIS